MSTKTYTFQMTITVDESLDKEEPHEVTFCTEDGTPISEDESLNIWSTLYRNIMLRIGATYTLHPSRGSFDIFDKRLKRIYGEEEELLLCAIMYNSTKKAPCVYLAYSEEKKLYKVGQSRDVYRRMTELGCDLLHHIPVPLRSINDYEKTIHNFLHDNNCHVTGEWFDIPPPLLDKIKSVHTTYQIRDIFRMWYHPEVLFKRERHRKWNIDNRFPYRIDDNAYDEIEAIIP